MSSFVLFIFLSARWTAGPPHCASSRWSCTSRWQLIDNVPMGICHLTLATPLPPHLQIAFDYLLGLAACSIRPTDFHTPNEGHCMSTTRALARALLPGQTAVRREDLPTLRKSLYAQSSATLARAQGSTAIASALVVKKNNVTFGGILMRGSSVQSTNLMNFCE
jgi:hypothetical protein